MAATLTLDPIEARVIASLVEKSVTTPQYYPLSVNAVLVACNQKSSRDPVMSLTEGEVGAALARLESQRLAKRDDQGSRVPKWRHRFQHELLLKEPVMAVLVTLMLRGPQTLAELRANAGTQFNPVVVEAFISSVVGERRRAVRGAAANTQQIFQQALEAVRARA
ncbi:MAG: DUF480 domain-containing protein [Panacagrimonas sp.]